MKKNLFLGMLAAVGMLFATSCSTDEPEAPLGSNEAQVTFALDIEGAAQTRAISDGSGAIKLVYAVYQKVNDRNYTLLKMPNSDDNSQFVKTDFEPAGDNVELTLAKGQTYTVVFWAQHPDCTAYNTTDLKKVTVDYTGGNNDETRDAFYKAETFTVNSDATISVTLKRPFAQINVGVTAESWEAAVATGVEIKESKVVIKDAPKTINLCTGGISTSKTDVTYDFAAIPTEKLLVDIDGDGTKEEYYYLSMSYILGNFNKTTLDDLEFVFKPASGKEIVFHEGLTNVPVQSNWRTNIIGSFLSNKITFNIVVDPAYSGDFNSPEYETIAPGVSLDAASKTYYLSSKKGLQWFNTQAQDGKMFEDYTVKLTADITFGDKETWTPIPEFKGTFDGCNYTIKNLKVTASGEDSAGLFASATGGTIKNLKMENVTIAGNWMAGAIIGCGRCTKIENCHVDGGSIISTPYWINGKYDNANNVGGIAGYLPAEPTAWVKDCSVSNLTITAYRDVGGIVGKAQFDAVISGNTVSNVTVTANQLDEYGEVKDANAGAVVGRNMNASDLSTNNANNNVRVNVLAISKTGTVTVDNNVSLPYIANLTNPAIKKIVLDGNVEGPAEASNPYGTTYGDNGINLQAGITLDGGGHSLTTNDATYWVIMVQGGTIKNFSAIEGGNRGIVTYAPTEDVIIDNVVIDQPGYALNTAENATKEGLKLIVRNSTLNGWSSWAGGFASAEFTNCNFGENSTKYHQNLGYDQIYDRLMKPYIATTFTNCTFVQGFFVDLGELPADTKIVLDQCTVDGTVITLDNYKELLGIPEENVDEYMETYVKPHVEFK